MRSGRQGSRLRRPDTGAWHFARPDDGIGPDAAALASAIAVRANAQSNCTFGRIFVSYHIPDYDQRRKTRKHAFSPGAASKERRDGMWRREALKHAFSPGGAAELRRRSVVPFVTQRPWTPEQTLHPNTLRGQWIVSPAANLIRRRVGVRNSVFGRGPVLLMYRSYRNPWFEEMLDSSAKPCTCRSTQHDARRQKGQLCAAREPRISTKMQPGPDRRFATSHRT